jgi:hypothetical protein
MTGASVDPPGEKGSRGTPAMVGPYPQTESGGSVDPLDDRWSGSSRVALDSGVGTSDELAAALTDPSPWTDSSATPEIRPGDLM